MTLGEWLDTRAPRPPEALRGRLDALLGGSRDRDMAEGAGLLLAAGEALAAELLHRGSTSRESALDLLAADALVTYAFEAASETPGEIVARATEGMRRIAALAHEPAAGATGAPGSRAR